MDESEHLRQRIARVDGGELVGGPSGSPYSVFFPPNQSQIVVYTTKDHAAYQLLAPVDCERSIGVICRYGLPEDDDLPGITAIVRDCSVYFLGDCDPFDLLVFAWLRQHLPVQFLGTSDAVVLALGVDVTESITIEFNDVEQRAMALVRETWPEFGNSVGPNCAGLLNRNQKLEIEALISYRTSPVRNLLNLM